MQFKNQKPIFQQICDYIEDQILESTWLPQHKIPSIRETAVEMQVNPNTVSRSYALLSDNGIIENRRGIGYFVADNAVEQITSYRKINFLEKEINDFFKTMSILDISWEELQELYSKWIDEVGGDR